mgnify:CR=1 FL=1
MPGNMLPNFQPARFRPFSALGGTSLTPTSTQTSVTDPNTGHVYTFSEAREVGQYQDGAWFVLGGAGNAVDITSITPVSTSVSTAAYTEADALDDVANTGAQTRWMHGAMINPGQGRLSPGTMNFGFDSYRGLTGSQASLYEHALNVDPGKTGAPLSLEEGSIVKAESDLLEGGHTASAADKTKLLKFSCLTVVPEIPAANSFRPSPRHLDKRSYWTTDQLNISGNRQIISGLRPFTTTQIDNAYDKIKQLQQTFYIHQEPSRRWNPGARGGGLDVYGDDWYTQFSLFFGSYHGDYTDSEITPITKAVVQVGIDIAGNFADGDYIYHSQAHHAGRKGIVFAAGKLLNNATILNYCDADTYPDNFGVDDAYCGYVTAAMVGIQPLYYKGAYPYKYETEHIGLPEWNAVFPGGNEDTVATEEQVVDPDIARRSYQVLSFDNGAMYQCLWGMIMDPANDYYKAAYFDFADRYLAIRFGDQIDGVWDASSDNTGTNGHFTGNWWSVNPDATTVGYFKQMRDSVTTRSNYVSQLIPEALPKPQVSHTGSNGYLEVDFNTNNFRMPQNKDAAITGYDLRWTAYAGGADTAASESVDEYIGNFNWHVIEDITLPYQLTAVPRGLKVKVQIRMKNVNGPGPWLDDRKRENYADQSTVFSALSGTTRYSTNFDVPDIAAFNQVPLNFGPPTASPETLVTGQTVTGDDGIWYNGPGTITTTRQWQVSDDGVTGWTNISGATASTFVTTAAQENKFVRPTVQKTNDEGTSVLAVGGSGVPVAPPVAIALGAGRPNGAAFDPGAGALGGKRLLIMYAHRDGTTPVSETGSIGAYNFTASEVLYRDNTSGSPEVGIAYQVVVPGGETAETITFSANDSQTAVAVYELTAEMVLTDSDNAKSSGLTTTVNTVSGGAAVWLGRSSNWVNFVSSAALTQHSDNPVQDTSTKLAAAHALGVSTGTVSVTHSNAAASNTEVFLVSLEPAA